MLERSFSGAVLSVGYYTEDRLERSGWKSGPWDAEPYDWAVWEDETTGFVCTIRRNHSGSWCGYVLLPFDHPIRRYRDGEHGNLTEGNPVWLDVHGGVTFDGPFRLEEADLAGVAVGFDCAHFGDLVPRYADRDAGHYRTAQFAIDEVQSLARQINEYEPLGQLVSGTNTNEECQ